MGQMMNCKDKTGMPLGKFVVSNFAEVASDKFEALVDDLAPLFSNISRRIKQSEGADFLNRNPKVNIDDYEPVVRRLQADFMKTKETFTAVIKEIPDRTNPFVMTMPEQISKLHSDVEELVAMQKKAKDDYVKMLDWMGMELKTKADDFCMMWDKFLVPESMLLAIEGPARSKIVIPSFCSDKAFYYSELQVIWGLKSVDDLLYQKKADGDEDKGKKGKKKKKDKKDKKNKDDDDDEGSPKAPKEGGATAARKSARLAGGLGDGTPGRK